MSRRINPWPSVADLFSALLVACFAGLVLVTATSVRQPAAPDDQPPIIVLKESEGYHFPSGSAELSADFVRRLVEKEVPELRRNIQRYQCDVIEVVGHTDSQPLRRNSKSNLDSKLLSLLHGAEAGLTPGSNADLGLMRAWEVILHLKRQGGWPENVKFHGFSAAQTLQPDGRPVPMGASRIDENRRRIEIRIRRSPAPPEP